MNDSPQNRNSVSGGDLSSASGNRFAPSPLSHTAMAVLKRSLEHNQLRRSTYRGSRLRVRMDGEEYELLAREGEVYKSFRVPLGAVYMEIWGDDREGDLLLGVFLIPEPSLGEDDQPQHLSVTLEGGQQLTLEIVLGDGIGPGGPEYVVQLSYVAAAEAETPGSKDLEVEALPAMLQPVPATLSNPGRGAIQRYRPDR
jgi:hypothetical protein